MVYMYQVKYYRNHKKKRRLVI